MTVVTMLAPLQIRENDWMIGQRRFDMEARQAGEKKRDERNVRRVSAEDDIDLLVLQAKNLTLGLYERDVGIEAFLDRPGVRICIGEQTRIRTC
jgi:hypothetical protein